MAGRIPQSFIDDLLTRIDIVDVIDGYVSLRKAGRNYQALCPFHEEKTPSFTVSREKQFYHCFGCGASGSVIGFLMEYAHLGFVEAVRRLAERAGLRLPEEPGSTSSASSMAPLYKALEQAARFYAAQLRTHPAAGRAVAYLKQRGLSGKIAAEFGLGYAPPGWDNLLRTLAPSAEAMRLFSQAGMLVHKEGGGCYDRFRDRIMFPIQDQIGRVIGFGARSLSEEQPKYLNSPETPLFRKGRELYGWHQARRACSELSRLLIVEGYMDVLALAQHGVHNVAATLGTASTKEHIERLFRAVPEITFCFDGDDAGERAAWRALEIALPSLTEGRRAGFLFMPRGEDPDSLVGKQGSAIFTDQEKITPLSDFLFSTLTKRVRLATLEGQAGLVDIARPLISTVPPGPLRQLLFKRLSELSGLGVDQPIPVRRLPTARITGRSNVPPGSAPPGLVRRAIAWLLRDPALALTVEAPQELAKLDMPGIPLLVSMLEIIREHPTITCGGILERWRGTKEGKHLSRLAAGDIVLSGDGMVDEFAAAIAQLRRRHARQRREALLKTAPEELTAQERQELYELLASTSSTRPHSTVSGGRMGN